MCWKSSILAALASAGFTLGTVAASELTVATRQVDDRKVVIATVEPLHLLTARARIGGTVIRLAVRKGDQVEAGERGIGCSHHHSDDNSADNVCLVDARLYDQPREPFRADLFHRHSGR